MSEIIKVENLGKKYIIDHEERESYTALRDVIAKNAKKVFSFPQWLKGEKTKVVHEDFWALKDVNFEIQQGDRVGIIGRNGAGKSTLLKILSRITEPSTGRIEINGRVASLLEVGTGFHPELTGRENIFLNGAILGMSRAEIRKKFDEIVDFAEVEKFLDTPVKRYSSGMYVRLAFAVAAHLEPEILVVDEVLAVGDAQFQKKCLGKMEDVSNSGRTVLFVSHNMAAIQNLCTNSIFLKQGSLLMQGKTSEVIEAYLSENSDKKYVWQGKHKDNEFLKINTILISKERVNIEEINDFFITDQLTLRINLTFYKQVSGIAFELFVSTLEGINVFSSFTQRESFAKSTYDIECTIPANIFNDMQYAFSIGISKDYTFFIVKLDEILLIEINNKIEELGGWTGEYPGITRPLLKWKINNKDLIHA